ncbi:MAG: NAD(P)H-hydrate epimerase [Candidatus Omnitrophota bacterium]
MVSKKGVTAFEMAEIDRRAQEEYGISQSILMENAGKSVAEVISEDCTSLDKERIAVFCGKGNNGGDGFVAARHLIRKKPLELVLFVMDMDKIKSGSAQDNFISARKEGISIRSLEEFNLLEKNERDFTIAIDALFGTGFKGELPKNCSNLGKMLNSSKNVKIYAVDIPSGLDATTGQASQNVPKAKKTITFGLPKKGFFINSGPFLCGEIVVKDIGFPQKLLSEYNT